LLLAARAARPVRFETPGMKLREMAGNVGRARKLALSHFCRSGLEKPNTAMRRAQINTGRRDGRSLRLRIKFEPWRGFYAFFIERPSSFHCVSFTLPPP